MLRISLSFVAVVCALTLFEGTCLAQRGGGRGMGGGGMRGGQMSGGGMMGSGGQGCRGGGGMMNSNGLANADTGGRGLMMGGRNSMMPTAMGLMNNAAIMNQNGGMNGMGCQRSQNSSRTSAMANQGNSNRMPQPTPQQFAMAAMRFDQNDDGLLNSEELTQVATAVVAELGQRQPRSSMFQGQISGGTQNVPSSAGQISEAFVARSLTFDADKDGALNLAETRKMAVALIRSLS